MMGVGGDFIDIREGKKNTHVGVFICDISGHGIVASLIASMVKISLQYWESTLTKPASVSDLVLKNLSGKLDRNFLTAIIGFMNTRTGEFKFANAGHPPLAFLPKNKDSVLLNARGKMIVEIMKPNCEEKSIQLEDGDKIVLYTDGITETRSLEGEMIGEEVFLKFLDSIKSKTPEEIVKLVSKYLDTYSSNTPMEDDCTMLVFEFYREKD
jgi:serine phosphatase RsbU (regulator of sigma subunit)